MRLQTKRVRRVLRSLSDTASASAPAPTILVFSFGIRWSGPEPAASADVLAMEQRLYACPPMDAAQGMMLAGYRHVATQIDGRAMRIEFIESGQRHELPRHELPRHELALLAGELLDKVRSLPTDVRSYVNDRTGASALLQALPPSIDVVRSGAAFAENLLSTRLESLRRAARLLRMHTSCALCSRAIVPKKPFDDTLREHYQSTFGAAAQRMVHTECLDRALRTSPRTSPQIESVIGCTERGKYPRLLHPKYDQLDYGQREYLLTPSARRQHV